MARPVHNLKVLSLTHSPHPLSVSHTLSLKPSISSSPFQALPFKLSQAFYFKLRLSSSAFQALTSL